ncbi:MAG TPA: GNAT family N-acetyltransferase [Thermoanaerobaculia bacterium]|nr:GNAT family N-acetyltransferase [Thermoanaerobaculia bacterium]
MRGQRLFVRAIETADHDAVIAFLATERPGGHAPACGLLGKVVGDIVAVVEMQITADAVQIDDIVVARDVRRKRIGRFLVDEVAQIAAKMERKQLVVNAGGEGDEFFLHIGFEREGTRWVRHVVG